MKPLNSILFAFLLLISACTCGNGDGYGTHCKFKANAPNRAHPDASGTINEEFYRLEPGFICMDSSTGLPLESYKDKITYIDGKFTSLGTLCQYREMELDSSLVQTSGALNLLGYKDGIYVKSVGVPALSGTGAYPELWCYQENSSHEAAVFRLFSNATFTGKFSLENSFQSALTLTLDGNIRKYESTGGSLSVDRSSTSAPVEERYTGEINGQTAHCRLNLP